MSKELVLRERKKDLFCKQQIQNRLNTNGEYFLDMDGVLYRRIKGKQPKLVVPHSLMQDVIAENHDPIFVPPGEQKDLRADISQVLVAENATKHRRVHHAL